MRKKGVVFLLAILLLIAANGIIGAIKCEDRTLNEEPATPSQEISETNAFDGNELDQEISGQTEKTEIDSWIGWQRAKISSDATVYSDKGMAQPSGTNLTEGKTVIVCEKTDGACKIRYNSTVGWVTEETVTLEGDSVAYERAIEITAPQSINGTELAAKLDDIAKRHDCIGVQMAVINDGHVSWLYEYGYGHRGNKTPMSSDTKLRAASVSKLIVAMGIMSMDDMGTVDIDHDISAYWSSPVQNPGYKEIPITFRNILTHTSSMEDFGYKKRATSALEGNLKQYTSYMTEKPGSIEAYDYNNSAICAAGAIAGNAAGCNFDRYIREYFFAPMDIDASFHAKNIRQQELLSPTYNDDTTTMTVDDLLNIKYYGGPADDYTLYAGGLIISAKDLAKMVCILIGGGQYDGMYYLSEQSVDEMLTRYYHLEEYDQCLVLRYRESMYNGESLYYHNGNLLGVYSLLCFNPETGNGLVIITNGADEPVLRDGVYSVCGDLAETAAELWN